MKSIKELHTPISVGGGVKPLFRNVLGGFLQCLSK